MTMNKRLMIYGLGSLAVAGALVFLFFVLFERVEQEIQTPSSWEARRNPFLAAERYLGECGIMATSVTSRDILITLPSPDDLIFINRMGGNLPPEREDQLIAWVGRGGTLVITADKYWDETRGKSGDTLLDRLGVQLHDGYALAEDENTDAETATDTQETTPESEPGGEAEADDEDWDDTEILAVGVDTDTVMELEFQAGMVLIDTDGTATESYDGDMGAHVLFKSLGDGRMVVLSDNDLLRNDWIGDNDHAFFLSRLAEGRGRVWILITSVMPSFLSVLVKQAPLPMASMALLLIFFMLWMTQRIGPRYALVDPSSRNILEHLLASGHFIRKHGIRNAHIHHARSVIEKNISAKYIYFSRLTEEQRFALIARWTRLSESDVRTAFTSDVNSSHAWVTVTGILQKIYAGILVDTTTTKEGVIGKHV